MTALYGLYWDSPCASADHRRSWTSLGRSACTGTRTALWHTESRCWGRSERKKTKVYIHSAEKKHMPDWTRFCLFVVFSVLTELGSAKKGMSAVEKAPLNKLTCVIITICTSFFSSWERLSALSRGNPGTSSVVRTWRLLSSSITSGT